MILRIASLNCRGLNKKLKRNTIFRKCSKYDIICLQETYITNISANVWRLEWPGEMFFSEGSNKSKGQIILINRKLQYQTAELFYKSDRILGVHICVDDVTFDIINVYGPVVKNEKCEFINKLYSIRPVLSADHSIICGDFNIVHNNELDIIAGEKHDTALTKKFSEWTLNCQMADVWRCFHGDEKDFTWSKQNPFIARRLDYIFCNTDLLPSVVESKHEIVCGTDHKAVVATVRTKEFRRGPSYWKFNNSLLQDAKFVRSMNICIDSFLKDSSEERNAMIRWELLKIAIKSHTIDFSLSKCRAMKEREERLAEELTSLSEQLVTTPQNKNLHSRFEIVKKELEVYQLHKARGAQVRSKTKWIEDGEKNTKYFLRLEKSRGSNNTITSIQDEGNSTILFDHGNIINHIKDNFVSLYTKDENVQTHSVDDYLNGCSYPSLDDTDKEMCDKPLCLEELDSVVNKLNNDSSPGIDGITSLFFKTFWDKLRIPLLQNFQYCLERGELSITQRRGVITLLHKGKNLRRDVIKNWRPITLTNTDYKIFSKVIALRLQPVMADLVHSNQTGFLKHRSISDHIRTLDDIIYIASQRNLSGMIVSLDFQRAFDTVEKETILATLEQFNFGENFINMVRVLMANSQCCIQNGGWLSEWFKTERGIKQGCCTSPLLFILVAEVMAIKLRNNVDILGIEPIWAGRVISFTKVLQYADDSTLVLRDGNDLAAALLDIEAFGRISGLKLNKNKSQGMWIGKSKGSTDKPGGIRWIEGGDIVKILGVYFSPTKEASQIDQNWTEKIENIKNIMKMWLKRNPSLYGKVLICKTFLLSQMSYIIQSLSLPDEVLNEIDALFFRFLWKKKNSNKRAREKVKRSVMCKSVSEGGLGVISIKDQQKVFLIKWLKRLAEEENNDNASIRTSNIFFAGVGGVNYFLSATDGCSSVDKHYPASKFWLSVMHSWLKINPLKKSTDSTLDFLMEPIFNNARIKYKRQSLYINRWVNSGIKHVYDLYEGRRFKTKEELSQLTGKYGGFELDYYAVVNAMPRQWMQDISNKSTDVERHKAKEVNTTVTKKVIETLGRPNKEIRNIITKDVLVEICGRNFWQRKLGVDISGKYIIAHRATKESRLRLLHFKILHNIYPSNILLNRLGLKSTEMCEHCGVKDYVEHMFIHCSLLQNFWSHVFHTIYLKTAARFSMSDCNILLGFSDQGPGVTETQINDANHILLIAKMCVSKMRYYGKSRNIRIIFELELEQREKYIRS